MDRYRPNGVLPLPIGTIDDSQFGGAFLEIHLDEIFYIAENIEWFYAAITAEGHPCIDVSKRTFYDADRCIDFISSYAWKKVFLTLTDHFAFLLPLIHDLPQIVYFYIYSAAPERIGFNSTDFPKLRAIVWKDASNADEQLLADIELFRRDLLPVNVLDATQRKTSVSTKDSLLLQRGNNDDEQVSIVWLKEPTDDFTLPTPIAPSHTYVNLDECVQHIQSQSDDINVFLIVSRADPDSFLQTLIDLRQVQSIYLFNCMANMGMTSKKIAKICSDPDELCEQVSKDRSRLLNMPVSIFHKDERERTVRNLSRENARFLWLQLLIDILLQIPHNEHSIDEMLDECQSYAANNASTMRVIEELRTNYRANDALSLYTGTGFLFKQFNRAFRTENIDFLFVFRRFFVDIHQHLRQLHQEQFLGQSSTGDHSLHLYRGQRMKKDEFAIIKEGEGSLISINCYFSTTKSFEVAEAFIGESSSAAEENVVRVIFYVLVEDTQLSVRRPFASIKELSKVKDEEEVLFSVGTLFRIGEITEITGSDEKWIVTLVLVSGDDANETSALRKELEEEFCSNANLSCLAAALIKMGEYDKAEKYCQMILEHTLRKDGVTPAMYTSLGVIACNKGDHQKALLMHQQALSLYLERNSFHDHADDIGGTYTHLGSNYVSLGEWQLAMDYFIKATEIQKAPRKHSFTFNQIAQFHRSKGNYQQALEYFQKALDIDERVRKLDKYHPEVATLYNNIGEIYIKLHQYDKARKILEDALDRRLKGTAPNHIDLAAIYNNLGAVYRQAMEIDKALEMCAKVLEIDMKALPGNHPSLALSHQNISAIYSQQNDLTKAVYHQETALRILLKGDGKHDPELMAVCQHGLGCLQLQLGDNRKALKMLEKALKTHQDYLHAKDPLLAHIHIALSQVYENTANITQALEHAEKAYDNASMTILPHYPEQFIAFELQRGLVRDKHAAMDPSQAKIGLLHAEVFSQIGAHDQLIAEYQCALECLAPEDFIERLNILNNLATTYSREEKYGEASKCFQEAISLFTRRHTLIPIEEQKVETIMLLVYFNFARLHYRQQNWQAAFHILQNALDLAPKQAQEGILLPEIYNFAAILFMKKGELTRAEHYFNLAIDIARKLLPENLPHLQRYCRQLEQLQDLMRQSGSNNRLHHPC